MTNNQKNLNQQWEKHSQKILETAINGINQTTFRERNRKLSEFPTEALQKELLSRQKCQFNRLTCTKIPEAWITPAKDPACWNCQQDILSINKDHVK